MKSTKGITLISLVITIIILLILVGVSINLLIGQNGLINRSINSKIQTDIASIKEKIQIDILGKQAEKEGKISEDSLKKILEEYGVLSEEEKLTDKTLTTKEGNYEIKVSDIFKGITVKDILKEPTFTTVANAPDISGFNKNSTYYVSWDLTSIPYIIKDTTPISETAPNSWYDYTERVNHWANIKTTGGGNDCYWVWIPRYAYKVPTKGNTAETIEVKFLKGKTKEPIDGSNITISNNTTEGSWNVHPAFWWDKNNNGTEDKGEQLTGIWVAKYEASSSSVNTINIENGTLTGDTNSLKGTGGGIDTNLKVRVKPKVTSWRGLKVNDIFTLCINLTTSGNSLEGTTSLDSHMIKNTEWGAVAYLSSSKYGKTDSAGNRVRVYNNPYYNGTTNYSTITGLSGKTGAQTNNGTTTDLYEYNTLEGIQASTTGNIYGIYDMAGGAWEYVAGIYKGGTSNDNTSKLWDSNNLRYVDQYTVTTGSQSNYCGNTDKFGDAVYETSSSSDSTSNSWDSSYSYFPLSSHAIFLRGGHPYYNCGVFAFYCETGVASSMHSFRPVVLSY